MTGLVTIAEVARELRIGRSLAYRLCTDGTIPSARIASAGTRRGRLVVRREDLDDYIERLFRVGNPTPARIDVDGLLARIRDSRA